MLRRTHLAMRGHYSMIHYCPDPGRAESVNVGVLVFCPTTGFLEARFSESDARAIEFFRLDAHDAERLQQMKVNLAERLRADRETLLDERALNLFIATRANKLILTPLRNLRLSDPADDFERLFQANV